MAAIDIKKALKQYDKRYYKTQLNDSDITKFSTVFRKYKDKTRKAIEADESEEHIKNLTNDFLKKIYIDDKYSVNTDKRIDSAIRVNNKTQVIIETKKPSNKSEMVTENRINVKALHEIIFYYLTETRDVSGNIVKRFPDTELRRCIITDTQIWVILDANAIEKIVDGYLEKLFYKYKNKQLVYANKNEKFYSDIKDYLKSISIEKNIDYVLFDLSRIETNNEIQDLYKLLSPEYLLKDKFDYLKTTHVLNDKFYQELLYIMGLKEVSGKTSKTIELDFSEKYTLANQVYSIMKNDKEYSEIECVEKTFELIIIWMNRLLFIKLFEGQLVSFNQDIECYRILDNSKITSFQDLQDLFFDVLGKKQRDDSDYCKQFSEIPYLNSSLFERYEIEKRELNINVIRNERISLKKHSVLGDKSKQKKLLLEYIIDFLNCYDFSSETTEDNTIVSSKDIIDASVLGLIFEKINGYRDGSFYTPSIITEYMCKDSIEKTIINSVNRKMGWKCNSLSEIKYNIGGSLESAKEVNRVINEIKICDISVGSGHFLVSALNRILFIKKRLGVLFKHNSEELLSEYDIDIVDDVIVVFDGQGKMFHYDKSNALSQEVQETLFYEKRTIIENCLFGVDINVKAVAICQLRLWIELLKSAFYKNGVMQTLPNIDINIKSGNSLVNKLPFVVGSKIGANNTELESDTIKVINEYKKLIKEYVGTSDKYKKNEIISKSNRIKRHLHNTCHQISVVIGENDELSYDYGEDVSPIYKNAFEWAIEFPELLDDKGVFTGFDCIIGNPPYGLLNKKQNKNTSISISSDLYEHYTNDPRYDAAKGGVPNIFRLFICRTFELLKKNGVCCLIFPLAFMCDETCSNIREYILGHAQVHIIDAFPERDNANKRVFKEVKMSVCILLASKKPASSKTKFEVRINRDKYVDRNNPTMQISYNDIALIDDAHYTIPLINQDELAIFLQMNRNSVSMKKYSKCYTGEIDLTLNKQFITSDSNESLMLRGAQVQKYYLTDDISQGEILYLKEQDYLSNVNSERSKHHNRRRIVMQGITGVNEKWRLKMTMAEPPYYCANSVNYLILSSESGFDYYVLGLLNSKLMNWYFSKLSTNSNVNGYEVDGLPIRKGTAEQQNYIIERVKKLLEEYSPELISEIDNEVYEIYGLEESDKILIEE